MAYHGIKANRGNNLKNISNISHQGFDGDNTGVLTVSQKGTKRLKWGPFISQG